MRHLAQLSLYNHLTTIIEIGGLFIYLVLFWGFYFIEKTITLQSVFLPFLIQSILGLIPLTFIIINIYKGCPNWNSKKRTKILKSRFKGFIYQVSTLLFSSNVLITVFASKFGFVVTSYLKITNYLAAIIPISIGMSSATILSQLKFRSNKEKREALHKIKTIFYLILFAILFTTTQFLEFKDALNHGALSLFKITLFVFDEIDQLLTRHRSLFALELKSTSERARVAFDQPNHRFEESIKERQRT